jgi:LacI family transcriptional regulator
LRRSGNVTIANVAAAAGVSKATVSRVMNDVPTVAPDIAHKVREIAGRLGYLPSVTAQNLSRGRTGTVGVLVPDLANPVYTVVLKAIAAAAGGDGYSLLVSDANEVPRQEPERAVELARQCDGLVLCGPRMDDAALATLTDTGLPIVVVNRRTPGNLFPSVWVDCGEAIHALCSHLRALGHRHLGYLAGPERSAADRDRWDAFKSASAEGMTIDRIPAGAMLDSGYRAAEEALGRGATCLVGYNDLVALGALAKLHESRIAVPGDVSVTGIDDITYARYTNPALTTIAVPQADLGTHAWRLLAPYLQGRRKHKRTTLTATLIIRDSAGPPPLQPRR